jgi:hypothetical protein
VKETDCPSVKIVMNQLDVKIQHLETKLGKLHYAGDKATPLILGWENDLVFLKDLRQCLGAFTIAHEPFREMAEQVLRRQHLFDEPDPEKVRAALKDIADKAVDWIDKHALRRFKNER